MTITITHTHESGTLLSGTSRGDGTAEVLKRVGSWRWSRNIGWYVRNSRDRNAHQWLIKSTKAGLEEAGFAVEVKIDDTFRPTAQAEADRAERQEGRADALAAKAVRKGQAAEDAYAAHERACEALPPGGEPIHVGHHSERRHRRAIDKAWGALGKAVNTGEEAERAEARAESAAKTTEHRYNPVTVKNRIDKLEAEQRRDQRELDGYKRVVARTADVVYADEWAPATGHRRDTLTERMMHRADQITYWQGVYAGLQVDGAASSYGPGDIAKGDHVKRRGDWYEVVRVNKKSVSVHLCPEFTWTHTIGYHEIQGYRPKDVTSTTTTPTNPTNLDEEAS
jgi:hypothetical protein